MTISKFQYVYVSEGNTFELLDMVKRQGVMKIIKQYFYRKRAI
jgi:peptidase E